ncbi:hypothetical protein I6F26_33075 [Ensifer sp. IC3342]|nr:hypothetical protein [Ensifer sp. BRP08]MCA1451263.1 hypothetical protein [Ensifer sp. IC3342]
MDIRRMDDTISVSPQIKLESAHELSALAWYLKAEALPPIYWHAMLKGREWLASPELKAEVA